MIPGPGVTLPDSLEQPWTATSRTRTSPDRRAAAPPSYGPALGLDSDLRPGPRDRLRPDVAKATDAVPTADSGDRVRRSAYGLDGGGADATWLVSAALVEVERGDYDAARALVSSFYESIDNHWQGAVPAQVPGPVTEIRRTRDETISLLSTSAPDAVQRIRSAHAAFLVVADPSAADIGRALATPRARPDSMAGRPGS